MTAKLDSLEVPNYEMVRNEAAQAIDSDKARYPEITEYEILLSKGSSVLIRGRGTQDDFHNCEDEGLGRAVVRLLKNLTTVAMIESMLAMDSGSKMAARDFLQLDLAVCDGHQAPSTLVETMVPRVYECLRRTCVLLDNALQAAVRSHLVAQFEDCLQSLLIINNDVVFHTFNVVLKMGKVPDGLVIHTGGLDVGDLLCNSVAHDQWTTSKERASNWAVPYGDLERHAAVFESTANRAFLFNNDDNGQVKDVAFSNIKKKPLMTWFCTRASVITELLAVDLQGNKNYFEVASSAQV